MSLINLNYDARCKSVSDINEHLPILSGLASECESVIELGVRGVVSSWAFAHGLKRGGRMFMNDLDDCVVNEFIRVAKAEKDIDATFVKGNDLEIELPPKSDILFIDTWHVYGQLKRELARYESLASKYIVLHDTTVDGEKGESLRMGMNILEQSNQTGIPVDEITKGLWPAVEEFLVAFPHWILKERLINNNGLTILTRSP